MPGACDDVNITNLNTYRTVSFWPVYEVLKEMRLHKMKVEQKLFHNHYGQCNRYYYVKKSQFITQPSIKKFNLIIN